MTAAVPVASRRCRFCKEEIAPTATVCPHCNRDLIPGRASPGPTLAVAARSDEAALGFTPAGLTRVSVVDIDMPFMSMVNFMVKWALASIPAVLILSAIAFAIFLMLGFFYGLASLGR